jgi:hypothetical protein
MHLKTVRSAGNGACALKGTTSRLMMARRPKVSFDQTAAPVPKIMDCSFYTFIPSYIFTASAEFYD